MDPFARLAGALLLAALLAGCASTKESASAIEVAERGPGLQAALRSSQSAATGTVRIFDYKDGVSLQLTVYSLLPGTYRIALHENGNCTSRNLFSAGPAWAPPGSKKAPGDLLPEFIVNQNGDMTSYVAFIPGARSDGPLSLRKRSVVLHWGEQINDALPGQPNNRLACGVLEPIEGSLL